jgi:hypothetical protein
MIWKMMAAAFFVSLVVFLEIFAGALHNDWVMLVVLVPTFLTPVPLLLLRCCSSDDAFSSGPRGMHWAQFMSGFFFTGCIALPAMLYKTHVVHVESMLLALSGIVLMMLGAGASACIAAKNDADSYASW